MKKVLLLSFLGLVSLNIAAQTLPDAPNKGFETWSLALTTTGQQEPKDYVTTEQIAYEFAGAALPNDFVQQSTDKRSGVFAVKLVSDSVAGFGIVPGIIISSDDPASIFSGGGGLPYNSATKPGSLKGFYKANILGEDIVSVLVVLTKYDEETGERLTLGFGEFSTDISKTAYTSFEAAIQYDPTFDGILPDTVTIVAQTGEFDGEVPNTIGTSLTLDDLSYTAATASINTKLANTSINVYPNPTSDVVKVSFADADVQVKEVNVFDVIGKKTINLNKYTLAKQELTIPVANLKNGIYFLSVTTNNGVVTKKFQKN